MKNKKGKLTFCGPIYITIDDGDDQRSSHLEPLTYRETEIITLDDGEEYYDKPQRNHVQIPKNSLIQNLKSTNMLGIDKAKVMEISDSEDHVENLENHVENLDNQVENLDHHVENLEDDVEILNNLVAKPEDDVGILDDDVSILEGHVKIREDDLKIVKTVDKAVGVVARDEYTISDDVIANTVSCIKSYGSKDDLGSVVGISGTASEINKHSDHVSTEETGDHIQNDRLKVGKKRLSTKTSTYSFDKTAVVSVHEGRVGRPRASKTRSSLRIKLYYSTELESDIDNGNLTLAANGVQTNRKRLSVGSTSSRPRQSQRPTKASRLTRISKTANLSQVQKRYNLRRSNTLTAKYEEMINTPFFDIISLGHSKIHGTGMFSKIRFGKGDLITEYMGKLISLKESNLREKMYFALGIKETLMFALGESYVVDPFPLDTPNYARMVNHSCEPNAFVETVYISGRDRLLLFAKKQIKIGEEITIDFLFEVSKKPEVPCNCGAKTCRKFIDG